MVVRLTHWINVLCMTVLLMSGLQIFNAHPALYWGSISDFEHPAWAVGQFPGWLTIPSYYSLADGRQWHFFFAWAFVINGLFYLVYGLFSRHVWRDLIPSVQDLRHLPAAIVEHARLHLPHGEAARRYNVLQRLTYLVVIFVLVPAIVLAGCAMSPRLDAGFPWLLDLFGGRQSARTVHFFAAWSLVAFVIVHVVMVVVSGPLNNMRSMITGRYVIRTGPVRP